MARNTVDIELVPGHIAPRDLGVECPCHKVWITEQGTEAGLPIVDFVCLDPNGNPIYFSFTGRIINGISAAVRGINQRIHGIDEP